MRLVTCVIPGSGYASSVAVVTETGLLDLSGPLDRAGTPVVDVAAVLNLELSSAELLDFVDSAALVLPDQVTFLPPVLAPSKVIGVGMNFHGFVAALGETVPRYPELFHKTAAALNGHLRPITIPYADTQAVAEGELAVVIGRRTWQVAPHDALAHIAGYTCANDVSARDLEFRTSQWTGGKMLPTFAPLGPALVTTDEVPEPSDLLLTTRIGDTVVQQASTSDMILDVPHLVSAVSHLVVLEAGDVLLTGTPSDLGALDPPTLLQHGDRVSVEIAHVGRLENPVVRVRPGDCHG